jgi:hypothetical protein
MLFIYLFLVFALVESSVQEHCTNRGNLGNGGCALNDTLPSSSTYSTSGSTSGNNIKLRAFIQRPVRSSVVQHSSEELVDCSELAFITKFPNATHAEHGIPETGLHSSIDRHSESMEIDIKSYLGPRTIYPIRNSLFHGHLCILIRDHPNCHYNFDNETNVYFELQIQGKFTRKLKGPLYMALEIPQTTEYKLSWTLRTIVKTAVRFIKCMGYDFVHMSYGGGKGGDTPHLSSPAFQAFDRLVITPEGGELPLLGYAIPEKYEDTVRRKKLDFDHRIDTNSTYTMSFNHTYANVAEWRVHSIPIIKSIDLGFTNDLRVMVYEIDDGGGNDDSIDGNVQAIAKSTIHRKKDVAWWVHFQRRNDSNE